MIYNKKGLSFDRVGQDGGGVRYAVLLLRLTWQFVPFKRCIIFISLEKSWHLLDKLV